MNRALWKPLKSDEESYGKFHRSMNDENREKGLRTPAGSTRARTVVACVPGRDSVTPPTDEITSLAAWCVRVHVVKRHSDDDDGGRLRKHRAPVRTREKRPTDSRTVAEESAAAALSVYDGAPGGGARHRLAVRQGGVYVRRGRTASRNVTHTHTHSHSLPVRFTIVWRVLRWRWSAAGHDRARRRWQHRTRSTLDRGFPGRRSHWRRNVDKKRKFLIKMSVKICVFGSFWRVSGQKIVENRTADEFWTVATCRAALASFVPTPNGPVNYR